MKKKIFIVSMIFIMLATCMMACNSKWYSNLPTKGKKFTLDTALWQETFTDNFDTLDYTKWKVNTMKSDDPLTNGRRRAGFYVDDSDILFTQDGNLTIRTKYKNGELGEGWYTSWLESSIDEHKEYVADAETYIGLAQRFGYFEIRCKVPAAVGIWSAFWLMPDGAKGMTSQDELMTGSDGIEIDVMESPYMYQKKEKNLNTHVLHGDGYKYLKSDKSKTYKVPNMYTEFHTYAMEWNETEYIFYIDGYETWRTRHSYKDPDTGKIVDLGVSKVEEYMLLSVEVAGSNENGVMNTGKVRNDKGELEDFWCGNPDANDKSGNFDFVVDYVKVYQRK